MTESITATNDKVLRWCQALHYEGLLSSPDLDKCTGQFAQLQQDNIFSPDANGDNTTGQPINEKVVKHELGLTPAQIREATLDPLKYMLDGDHKQTLQIEIDHIHVDPDTSILRIRDRLEAPSHFNLINRGSKVGVLLQHMDTGRYVTLKHMDRKGNNIIAIASLETPDASSYFYCKSTGATNLSDKAHKWYLESTTNSGYALELLDAPIGRLVLSKMTTQKQQLQISVIRTTNTSNNTGTAETSNEFTAEDARAQVDDILANVNQQRLTYYRLMAVKEYLIGLRDQMRVIVAREGPLMDYYYQTIGNAYNSQNPSNSDQQLRAISASISSELESNEIAAITSMIDQLDIDIKAYAAGPLATTTAKIPKLYKSIDTSIARRNRQIDQLSEVLDKVNRDQKQMTYELDNLDKTNDHNQRRQTVSTTNNDIIRKFKSTQQWQYWGAIALLILLVVCIGIFGHKLWQTARKELY